jgi:hypothetical protein
MEAVATISRARSSSRLAKINWQFLTFWLSYFSMIFGVGYAMF